MNEEKKVIEWKVEAEAESPAIAVAGVLFGIEGRELKILLARRGGAAFEGKWALPGDEVRPNESLKEAVLRALGSAGIHQTWLKQLHTFGKVGRNPGKRLVTTTFYVLASVASLRGIDKDRRWYLIHELPSLAIDHGRMVDLALKRLRDSLRARPIGKNLLPPRFTIKELQTLYEAILQRQLDPVEFRRQMWKIDLLVPLELRSGGKHPSSERLYRFNWKRYRQYKDSGLHMDL